MSRIKIEKQIKNGQCDVKFCLCDYKTSDELKTTIRHTAQRYRSHGWTFERLSTQGAHIIIRFRAKETVKFLNT